MKILFLCGCLEIGRDGVGDYTRRLCGELLRQGHTVEAIALNDAYIDKDYSGEQEVDGAILPVLRIAYGTLSKKIIDLKKIMNVFNPDYVSFQFVPFSFHPKGLSASLSSNLKTLFSGFKIHIMFHELWVGIDGEVKIKMKLLGFAQKILIMELIRNVNPSLITTSTSIYRKALSNFDVKILPLFSNVPIVSYEDCTTQISENFRIVHFGSFSGAVNEFELQLKHLMNLAHSCSKEMELITFGGGGSNKERALKVAKKLLGTDKVKELGRLSFKDISCVLQNADAGISRANHNLCGKSGSTLAMIEHGLPVLLRGKRNDVDISLSTSDNQYFFCDSALSSMLNKWPAKNGLKETAKIFIEFLN